MKDQTIIEDIEIIKESIDQDAFQGKSILVSGGSGFLGSWICDVLSSMGSRVICLDNLSTGVFENVEHLRGTKVFEFEKADVCTYSGKPKVDMVFHLASRPAPEDYQKHPVETALVNATGTDRMLDLARRNDARVFYASSSEAYGEAEVFPTPESYEGKVDPIGPRSSYEEGKRFGEALCKAYRDQHGLETRVARIFNSYGPRLRPDGLYGRVISRFILQAFRGISLTVYGDGKQTRSFCYVSDTIAAILKLMVLENPPFHTLNIGHPVETRIIDLANAVLAMTENTTQIAYRAFPAGDHKRRKPDIGRAERTLNWSPRVGLDEGLRKTFQSIVQHSTRQFGSHDSGDPNSRADIRSN